MIRILLFFFSSASAYAILRPVHHIAYAQKNAAYSIDS
jgi:hypothetical protein